jgi:ketosteroid isomerase-like protein
MSHPKLIGLAILVVLFGCRPAAPAPLSEADRALIRRTADSALAFANATPADWPSYVRAYYAEDAISLPSNGPAQIGAAAIASAASSTPPSLTFRWQLLEIDGYHDLAYVRGRWWVTTPGTNPHAADSGNYLEVWRRQPEGRWRVARDMYASEVPPKASPAPTAP